MWSTTTRMDSNILRHNLKPRSATASYPSDRAGCQRDQDEPPPRQGGLPEPAPRRAVDVIDRHGGPNADPRPLDCVLAGHRDRRWDGRCRDADARGKATRHVGRRRERRNTLFLRIELAKDRQVVVVD